MRDGLLLIDKAAGGTSHDMVQKARRILKEKRIGHCGTLDPDATGLLLLTVGLSTRLTRFLIKAPKVYQGIIHFGRATDTYDASGKTISEGSTADLTHERIAELMATLVGTFEQQPPPYSAKKIQGVRYYELARRGEETPTDTREVTVFEFSPHGDLHDDRIEFRLGCTSGTYARTMAHDLGAKLGCGAHLAALRRTKIGPFEVAQAVTLDQLAEQAAAEAEGRGELGSCWIPFDEIPLPFGEVTADTQQEQRIRHGQTVLVRELAGEEGDWVKLLNRRREMIAVGTVIERIGAGGVGIVQPKVVFR